MQISEGLKTFDQLKKEEKEFLLSSETISNCFHTYLNYLEILKTLNSEAVLIIQEKFELLVNRMNKEKEFQNHKDEYEFYIQNMFRPLFNMVLDTNNKSDIEKDETVKLILKIPKDSQVKYTENKKKLIAIFKEASKEELELLLKNISERFNENSLNIREIRFLKELIQIILKEK